MRGYAGTASRGALTVAKRVFYETRGVSRAATDGELKSAFRKAALQCHPDRHPGDNTVEVKEVVDLATIPLF